MKIIGGALVISLLAAVGISLALQQGLSDMCSNAPYWEYVSPDRQLKAVVFERDCGATTGRSTHVAVIAAVRGIGNEPGNILIVDGVPGQVAPAIKWVGNRRLRIYRALNGSEYKAVTNFDSPGALEIVYGPEADAH